MINNHSEKATDTRNVVDEFRGMSVEAIKAALDMRRHRFHIAIENIERDFNAGTIVRNANAFNAAGVHIIGRRQWNKRGAMVTDRYMDVFYHAGVADFVAVVKDMHIVGVDNVEGSKPLTGLSLPENVVFVFGSEGPGLSKEMIAASEQLVRIEQFGSTRSINVGVASGIVMYCWLQQFVL